MRISTKGRYALRALLELIDAGGEKQPVLLSTISHKQAIPEPYLMNIFSLLRRHEVVRSQRGCRGGFLLGKRAEDITLLEILEITEGPLDIIGCLVNSGRGCERERRCGIQPVWRKINAQIRDLFADKTLRDVWEEAKLSKHKEVSYVI